jgi:hypothetical protein
MEEKEGGSPGGMRGGEGMRRDATRKRVAAWPDACWLLVPVA